MKLLKIAPFIFLLISLAACDFDLSPEPSSSHNASGIPLPRADNDDFDPNNCSDDEIYLTNMTIGQGLPFEICILDDYVEIEFDADEAFDGTVSFTVVPISSEGCSRHLGIVMESKSVSVAAGSTGNKVRYDFNRHFSHFGNRLAMPFGTYQFKFGFRRTGAPVNASFTRYMADTYINIGPCR